MANYNLTQTGAQVQSILNDVANKAPSASPTFTGTPTAPTPTAGDTSTKVATTKFVDDSFAKKDSPVFTGDPKAPTPAVTDDDTSIATSAMVQARAKIIPQLVNSASRSLALTDAGKFILCDAGSGTITMTVPTNATVAFPIGTQIVFVRSNVAVVNFTPASGVTLLSSDSRRTIYKTYETATLVKYATDTWFLFGSLS